MCGAVDVAACQMCTKACLLLVDLHLQSLGTAFGDATPLTTLFLHWWRGCRPNTEME